MPEGNQGIRVLRNSSFPGNSWQDYATNRMTTLPLNWNFSFSGIEKVCSFKF